MNYVNSVAPELKKVYQSVIDFKNNYASNQKEKAAQILNNLNVNF